MKQSLELKRLQSIKKTKTYDFLLPLTGYSKVDLDPYLVNAYLGDAQLLDWDLESPDIFMLMKYSGQMHFYKLEKEIEKHEYFNTSYSLFRGRYIMFVFTLGATFVKDYHLFLKGKYSKMSQPAKIRIMRHRTPKSAIPFILDKDLVMRTYWEKKLDAQLPEESEVWPIMSYDEELFDREQFKKQMSISDLPLNLL